MMQSNAGMISSASGMLAYAKIQNQTTWPHLFIYLMNGLPTQCRSMILCIFKFLSYGALCQQLIPYQNQSVILV